MSEQNYPYVSTWSTKTAEEMFINLINYESTTIPLNLDRIKDKIPRKYKKEFEDGIVFITKDSDLTEYTDINAISDFFTEKLRLTTSRRKFMKDTPMQMWIKYSKDIIKLAKDQYGDTSPYHVRLAAFTITKESVNFRPTIALSIYNYFNPKSILDISAGWGDRLIAALAYAKAFHPDFERYVGFDPNTKLQESYMQIVSRFLPEGMKHEQFSVYPEPFEHSIATLRKLNFKFDLVFSSIPYFNLEYYDVNTSATGVNQSVTNYPTIDMWISHFLVPSIRICGRFLEQDGYLAINMEGLFVTLLFERYDRVFTDAKLTYEGIFGYASDRIDDKRVHPVYVWKKNN